MVFYARDWHFIARLNLPRSASSPRILLQFCQQHGRALPFPCIRYQMDHAQHPSAFHTSRADLYESKFFCSTQYHIAFERKNIIHTLFSLHPCTQGLKTKTQNRFGTIHMSQRQSAGSSSQSFHS